MKPTTEKETTEQAPEPQPALLSLEAAELILDGILIDCSYDEWAVDGMLRVIWTLTHQESPGYAETFCEELVKRVYHLTNDCWYKSADYLASLANKSYRDDGLTVEHLVALQSPDRERIENALAAITGEKPKPPRNPADSRPLGEVQLALNRALNDYVAHPDVPAEVAQEWKEKVSRLRSTEHFVR